MRVEQGVTTRDVIEHPLLSEVTTLAAGADGLTRIIDHPRVQKSGLALVGHLNGVVPTRIQVLGETEMTYLESLSTDQRRQRLTELMSLSPSLIIVSRGVVPMAELVETARASDTPLVVASPRSSRTIQLCHQVLDQLLAPAQSMHGVLIDVHGVGVLLVGPSGIGKSECALFLLERGHRLVADDVVELTRMPTGQLIGRAPPLLRYHLELRGLGIINARDLFGATAVRDDKWVQLLVELCPWEEGESYERLGLDDQTTQLLGESIPKLTIPVRPGRNMAVILEVAARNHILKSAGHHGAKNLISTITGTVRTDSDAES